jgi:hypothetical protein
MTASTDFYLGSGDRIFRDVAAGPDTPALVPKWVSTLTPAEVQVLLDLNSSNPLRQAVEKVYSDNDEPLTSAQAQAKHTASIAQTFPTSKSYGKAVYHEIPQGVNVWSPLLISMWSKIRSRWGKGGSIVQIKHGTDSTPRALFKYKVDDYAGQSSISGIPEVEGVQLYGDRSSLSNSDKALVVEHGIWLPEPTAGSNGKTDGIHLTRVVASGFNGDGMRVDRFHNALRLNDARFIDNKGAGFRGNKISDMKWFNFSAGRNEEIQAEFTDCASPQLIGGDIWNPGGSAFTGLYASAFYSCANWRMAFLEHNGMLNIEGDNSDSGSSKRYYGQGALVLGMTLKASKDTYLGTQYVGGGGALAYDSQVRVKSAHGMNFAFLTTTRGEFDEYDPLLPKYIFDISVKSGGAAGEEGYVTLTSPSLREATRSASADKVVLSYRQHWAKQPSLCVWRTTKPGQLLMLPTATDQVNLIKLTGSVQTLLKVKYPELYLGMDDTRSLLTGNDATTFDIPAAAGTLPAGYSWFIVAW